MVAGGGLIGTAIAWRLRQAGLDVVLVPGERAAAASQVAAGMLAPVTEVTFTEPELLLLNLASRPRYADFTAEVEQASDLSAGLRRTADPVGRPRRRRRRPADRVRRLPRPAAAIPPSG